jgi:hypothetical protein
MNRIIISTTLTIAAFSLFAVRGQDLPESPNRFSFGPTIGINFKAGFYNNVNPGPNNGLANHTYNDGYVLVDGTGDNHAGLEDTYFWGYRNASQVAGGNINFHAIQDSSSVTGNPQYGGEFIYQRVIGNLPFLTGDWGLEAGFGFTELDLRENLGGTVPVIMDSYQLNGPAPGPGYNGTFQGPGSLLNDTPTRTATTATLTGYQKLSGQLFSLRLGPFAEWKFTDKLSLAGSVGLTLAPAMVDYDFSEIATLAGAGGMIAASGHSSETKLLYGPYVGAMLRYDFDKHWGVFVGARFQNLTDMNQSIGSRTAKLDPSATLYATAGVSWKF